MMIYVNDKLMDYVNDELMTSHSHLIIQWLFKCGASCKIISNLVVDDKIMLCCVKNVATMCKFNVTVMKYVDDVIICWWYHKYVDDVIQVYVSR